MKITLRELDSLGKLDAFIALKKWNPWCLNEGTVRMDDEVEISLNEVYDLKILKFLYAKCPECSNTLGHGRPNGAPKNVFRCGNCKTIFTA